eukprot:gene18558-24281_t
MFGGRDNDGKYSHIPKTYNIEKVNGTIIFTTYDQKPVNPCTDATGEYYTAEQRASCTTNATEAALIDIGIIYNDVWAYKLCEQSDRIFDGPCENTGWIQWHPGGLQGDCTIELGITVCNVPSESQRCADYCDDLWFFDIYKRAWKQVYEAKALTYLYNESFTYTIYKYIYNDSEVPRDSASPPHAGPGARWRHSIVTAKPFNESDGSLLQTMTAKSYNKSHGVLVQRMYIFGGHRLWQGFSQENSQYNDWSNYTTREQGGYLDDFWMYTKVLDFATLPNADYKKANGLWTYIHPKKRCESNPGITWDSRFDIGCVYLWPTARAGHGMAYDDKRHLIWLFGGYSTYYPYIRTDGAGSGSGISSVGSGGFIPYPGYDYFKNDLWYYNTSDSYWYKVDYPDGTAVPDARVDMIFLIVGDALFMNGGFADSYYYDDTWFFNITTMLWLKKSKQVYPQYPPTCTDDLEYIKNNNCTQLFFPKELNRSSTYPYDILPYSDQPYYWPNRDRGPYYPIQNKNFDKNPLLNYSDFAIDGTPEVPYAATGPYQYVKSFVYEFNSTHNATVYEYCLSVSGEPTRGKLLDGLYGRASSPVYIKQPRRKRPGWDGCRDRWDGWDGCRDRWDGRTDLPLELQYLRPLQRSSHRAIFHEKMNEIIMYGGIGYYLEEPLSYTSTWSTEVKHDMWVFNLFYCTNNCSFHGDCYYGFCTCYVGYYGEDCSNTSCPGTYCSYNITTHDQSCVHACHAGYTHTDNDIYVPNVYKLPCTLDNPGESNGVCDGFGTAQCAPPFIGEDCSIKDCKYNCSFNGFCSVEYPVSRCLCIPGYYGEYCQYLNCLNNCSYPNGICNSTTGICDCQMTYSPYNNTRPYHPWAGEDCSYLLAYAKGYKNYDIISYFYFLVLILLLIIVTNR